MLKTRILLVTAGVLIVAGLYMLPMAVVENDASAMKDSTVATTAGHKEVSAAQRDGIADLRRRLTDSSSADRNNPIFADSLGSLYAEAGLLDSAAIWYEQAAVLDPAGNRVGKAADAWFLASEMSIDATQTSERAGRARELFAKMLEKEPGNTDLKVKLALTYMATSAPMQGVTMLREVLANDPQHEQALLNMGKLSIRSGQYAKAVDWFSRLTKAHPENLEGQLLLGKAWAETGEKEKAREQYARTAKMTNDPAVQQQLEQLIKELN